MSPFDARFLLNIVLILNDLCGCQREDVSVFFPDSEDRYKVNNFLLEEPQFSISSQVLFLDFLELRVELIVLFSNQIFALLLAVLVTIPNSLDC